jgi:hypothetical protein
MPNVAGIVLTGGRRPPRFFDQILKGVPKQALSMPVCTREALPWPLFCLCHAIALTPVLVLSPQVFIVEADTFQTVTVANQACTSV